MRTFRVIFKNDKGQPHAVSVQAANGSTDADVWTACQAQYPAAAKGRLIKVIKP